MAQNPAFNVGPSEMIVAWTYRINRLHQWNPYNRQLQVASHPRHVTPAEAGPRDAKTQRCVVQCTPIAAHLDCSPSCISAASFHRFWILTQAIQFEPICRLLTVLQHLWARPCANVLHSNPIVYDTFSTTFRPSLNEPRHHHRLTAPSIKRG